MVKVWKLLAASRIVFLPIHDEIIIPVSQVNKAREIMNEVFRKEFTYFKINGEKKDLFEPTLSTLPTPIPEKPAFQANQDVLPKKTSTPIIIDPEILDLHAAYTKFEQEGLLDTHPQRSYIGSMWQGVLIYYHKPDALRFYLDELRAIQQSINNCQNNEK